MPCPEGSTIGNLIIKWSNDPNQDPGTRPLSACDGSIPYWDSANIWLQEGSSSAHLTQVTVGHTYTPFVNVSNKSTNLQYADITVELWICDFTMGIGPASALPSTLVNGNGLFQGFAPTLNASSSIAIPMGRTWTPGTDALVNNGHVCMGANCFGTDAEGNSEGASLGPQGFNFCCNPHHGQRNLAVVNVTGRMMHHMDFRFSAFNPNATVGEEFVVDLREVHDKDALRDAELESLRSYGHHGPHVRLSPLRTIDLGLQGPRSQRGQRLKLELRGHEKALLVLHADFDTKETPGNVHVFDAVQFDHLGDAIGAARILAVTTN